MIQYELASRTPPQLQIRSIVNGYVCNSHLGTEILSMNGSKSAGKPEQHVPAVLYTTTTLAGFEARRNAAARQPRAIGNAIKRQIGSHDRRLI